MNEAADGRKQDTSTEKLVRRGELSTTSSNRTVQDIASTSNAPKWSDLIKQKNEGVLLGTMRRRKKLSLDEGSRGLKRLKRKVGALQKMFPADPHTRKFATQTTAQIVKKRASRKARLSPTSRDWGTWGFASQPAWERPKGDNPNLSIHRPDLDAYGSKLSVDRHSRKLADLEDTAKLLRQRSSPPYRTSM